MNEYDPPKKVVHFISRVDAIWNKYVDAHRHAQKTLAMSDGIEAARAWRDWLEEYMMQEQIDFCVRNAPKQNGSNQ